MTRHTLYIPPLLLAAALALACATPDAASPGDNAFSPASGPLPGGLRFDSTIHINANGTFGRPIDWDGDGKHDFFTVHVGGNRQFGAVGVKDGSLAASLAMPITTMFDGGSLEPSVVREVGDVTGDGRADLLQLHNANGLRMIQRSDGGLSGLNWHPWGNRVDGWLLSYTDSYYGAVDVDGDGNNELLVSSSWGLITFNVDARGGLSVYNSVERNRYLAGDLFYLDAQARFVGSGKFWGGAENQVVMRNARGLGVAFIPSKASGSYSSIDFAPWGQMQQGGWRIDSNNEIVGTGDVDGDGREDIVLWSPWGVGVLSTSDWFYGTTAFDTKTAFVWGTSVAGAPVQRSSWPSGSEGAMDVVDDFNGDGRADIVINDDSGRLIILGYAPETKTLSALAVLNKGATARGGWTYDGSNQLRGRVGRFGASDRASILEDSTWGVGVLGIDAAGFHLIAAAQFETSCGNGKCEAGETCSSCSGDCGRCPEPVGCGNGKCEAGETCSTCSKDCGRCPETEICGNLICGRGETCASCPKDCQSSYQFCQFCPNGAGYNRWELKVSACSASEAYSKAIAATTCTKGEVQAGPCPSR